MKERLGARGGNGQPCLDAGAERHPVRKPLSLAQVDNCAFLNRRVLTSPCHPGIASRAMRRTKLLWIFGVSSFLTIDQTPRARSRRASPAVPPASAHPRRLQRSPCRSDWGQRRGLPQAAAARRGEKAALAGAV